MDDLIAFLRARLDEDAAAARAATSGPWWYNPGKQWLEGEAFESYDLAKGLEFVGYGGPHPFTGAVAGTGPADHPQSMADAHFIARHDPARVLAEVDAKRRLVALHEPVILRAGGGAAHFDTTRVCRSCEPPKQFPETAYPCETVRLLALPYAGHPDYRDEWRP